MHKYKPNDIYEQLRSDFAIPLASRAHRDTCVQLMGRRGNRAAKRDKKGKRPQNGAHGGASVEAKELRPTSQTSAKLPWKLKLIQSKMNKVLKNSLYTLNLAT